jgi:hypothetical protein
MPVKEWNPAVVIEGAMKRSEERIAKACPVVVRNIKVLLNKKGEGPSSPGESPRKVTGRLYDSIFFKVVRENDEVVGYIYSNDIKARRLELGFVGKDSLGRFYDQAPRPFMRPGLANSHDQVKKILGGK